ncbi:MAG: hypothetical protein P1V20_00805 [Verrucomicrobiales bacterium]|nr:hypothetical protein [Verrucomicrobiales bacterium]
MRNLCLPFFLLLVTAAVSTAETRVWTSSGGKQIDATILAVDGDTVRLETSRGKFELPLSRLSEADQNYAKKWAKKKAEMSAKKEPAKNVATTLGDFDDLTLGEWPQYVVAELENDQIEIVETDEEGTKGEFLYRTPHFEFQSPDRLSNSVVREFARIFEASFAFVDQMPIGLAPRPSANGYFQTKLYMTRESYYENGGVPGSGGMFSFRYRGEEMSGKIHVPLPNLGVEYTGTRYIVDHKKRSTTLTHEIVHQVMMRWLATPMPVWLSEGLAEVVSSQEYNNGRFKLNSMDRAIVDEVTRGRSRDFHMLNLERLMNITNAEWAADLTRNGSNNYNSASVLTYYFLKLEGAGDGAFLVHFLQDIAASGRDSEIVKKAQANHLIRERSYEKLQEDVAAAWRSEGLKIEFH